MNAISYSIYILMCLALSTFGQIIVKEPDDSEIERPCSLDDLKCMQKELFKYNLCKRGHKVQNPNEPYRSKNVVFELTSVNTTANDKDVSVKGLGDGEIIEFYINKKTDRVILSISFTDIAIKEVGVFRYHRKAREDLIIIVSEATENYPSIVTTTALLGLKKGASHERWSHARVDVLPEYNFGDISHVENEEALAFFEAVAQNVGAAVQELFFVRAPLFADFYIDNVICNKKYQPNDHSKPC